MVGSRHEFDSILVSLPRRSPPRAASVPISNVSMTFAGIYRNGLLCDWQETWGSRIRPILHSRWSASRLQGGTAVRIGNRFTRNTGGERRRGRPAAAVGFALCGFALSGCTRFPDAPRMTAGCRATPVVVEGGTGDPARLHIFAGPEDITIDHAAGIAYISASPRAEEREAVRDGQPELPQGDIYAIDLREFRSSPAGPLRLRNLTSDYSDDHDFHPHGMSLLVDSAGSAQKLLVINHAQAQDSDGSRRRDVVVRFRLQGTGLVEDGEFDLGGLCNANDIAAFDSERFLVSSLSEACEPPAQLVEVIEDGRKGSIVLFDHGVAVREWSGLRAANGVTIAPGRRPSDPREVYVADTVSGEIRRYTIRLDPEPVLLDVDTVLDGAGGVDNMEWSGEGELSVATHPDLFRFLLYGTCRQQGWWCAEWPPYTATAPSAAFRFRPGEGRQRLDAASLTYADDGTQQSASSVAAVDGDTTVIGSVFSDRLVVCETDEKEKKD